MEVYVTGGHLDGIRDRVAVNTKQEKVSLKDRLIAAKDQTVNGNGTGSKPKILSVSDIREKALEKVKALQEFDYKEKLLGFTRNTSNHLDSMKKGFSKWMPIVGGGLLFLWKWFKTTKLATLLGGLGVRLLSPLKGLFTALGGVIAAGLGGIKKLLFKLAGPLLKYLGYEELADRLTGDNNIIDGGDNDDEVEALAGGDASGRVQR
jgi:hypothetical protein